MTTKIATCSMSVPAILSPTKNKIDVGEKVEYVSIKFRNGEHHLILANKEQIPAIFFYTE